MIILKFYKMPLFIFILLTLTITSYSFVLKFFVVNYAKRNVPEQTTFTNSVSYTLKDYNGKIAIFFDNNKSPSKVYDCYTSLLPREDRTAIESGITVYSKEDLIKLIEDYTS